MTGFALPTQTLGSVLFSKHFQVDADLRVCDILVLVLLPYDDHGMVEETCRDFAHTSCGLASTFNVAETALIQGLEPQRK